MTIDVMKQIWPEWEIEEKPLGKGSFGVVYKAVRSDHNVKSYAAIKVISIPADPSEVDSLRSEGLDISATKTYLRGIVDDFVNEIQLMESLKGVQNIVSVEDYKVVEKTGEIGWDIFIRMELLTTFNAYICDKKLTEEEVIKLGCDICTALEICGQRKIIHRDIKPENIFINDFGYFKLGDFGIARKLENMTGGLSQKGTFNYMAPEVATGNNYDSRVDTYSLGIVLYRLLNGNRLPFLDTEKQLLNPNERKNAVDRRLRGEALPAPCDASPAMADVILRACAHNPNMRFSSATEMKQALMSIASGTYSMVGALNATIPIHGTPAVYGQQVDQSVNTVTLEGNPNGTISVRRAYDTFNQQANQMVNTFGPTPKKNFKLIIIIASALAVAIIVGVGIFVVPKLLKNSDGHNSNGTSESSTYESADYSEFKEKTLAEAKNLATAGDYVSAITLIKNAQDTYGDDADYQNAYESYCSSYKSKVISESDELANSGDYDGANQKINEAIAVLGEDIELAQKISDYQLDSYISKAEAYAENKNFVEALATLDTAQQILGEHERINEERFKIQKGQLLNTVTKYVESGNYADAINAIENSDATLKSDPEIIQKSNELRLTYKNDVIARADSEYKDANYDEAVSILSSSLSIFPDDADITAKIEKYTPVNFIMLTQNHKSSDITTETVANDPQGNSYSDVLFFDASAYFGALPTPYIESYTGGQYTKFTATIVAHKDMDRYSKNCGAVVKIYADDRLIYTSDPMKRKSSPVFVDVDISGTQYLKIQVEPTWSLQDYMNSYSIMLCDAKVYH